MPQQTNDRQWEEAARSVSALRKQFTDLGVPPAAMDVWLRPFCAELVNRYDGSQEIPAGAGDLSALCAAKPFPAADVA